MLQLKVKKFVGYFLFIMVISSVLFAGNAYAQNKPLFSDLMDTGSIIFTGMREVVFAVSGFGIVAVAVGGFFGIINWRWLSAIIIGLVVIAVTAQILNYMTEGQHKGKGGDRSFSNITDTLVSGKD